MSISRELALQELPGMEPSVFLIQPALLGSIKKILNATLSLKDVYPLHPGTVLVAKLETPVLTELISEAEGASPTFPVKMVKSGMIA